MSWQLTTLLSVILIWGSRVLSDWLRLREERRLAAPTPVPPVPHKCSTADMEPVDAKLLTSDLTLSWHQTILLKRCRTCGAHVAEVFGGKWVIGDFLKTKADMNWLKEQVG